MTDHSKIIVLEVYGADYDDILRAIALRRTHLVPATRGNDDGRTLAEVCRDWLERTPLARAKAKKERSKG